MCDSSPLFFSAVFQQSHPIPVVNKTVLLKKHPFGSIYPLCLFSSLNYFASIYKQQVPHLQPQMHQLAWFNRQASLSGVCIKQHCTTHTVEPCSGNPLRHCCAPLAASVPLSMFPKCSKYPWHRNK